ncbi:MAG TPA: hypothetical protein VM888_10720 [Chitinophagaceae bacterium]|jgi:hypothetical protein|nr:hypothetical protein [Chitinophagaceae bacterium]
MNSNNAIQDELKDLGSTLTHEHARPVFDLPESYFENFAASVLARIKREQEVNAHDELKNLSSTLSAIPRKMPFSIPEAYFSSLTQDLPSLIKEDSLPQMLDVPTRTVPYEVPAGYFENLPAQLMNRVSKPKTKVISLGSKRILYYATAAMIAGLMAITGIMYFKSTNTKSIDPAKQPNDWVAKKLENFSSKELEEFINITDVGVHKNDLAQNSGTTQEVRQLLKDVPDNELDAFLNAIPSDIEDLSTTN